MPDPGADPATRYPRTRALAERVCVLGILLGLLSLHLMETYPAWALGLAVLGAGVWLAGALGATVLEA